MYWEKICEKGKELYQKIGKKTIVTLCTIVVIGCMVVLNIFLFAGKDDDKGNMKLAMDLSSDGNQTSQSSNSSVSNDYFQSMNLNRQQARDEAMEVLLSVAESQTALADAKEAALSDMSKLAADMEKESNIETMILSKGFAQCIAVISNDTCNVIIGTEGLDPGDVAQITEIVYEQAGILPTNLKIVEKNITEA